MIISIRVIPNAKKSRVVEEENSLSAKGGSLPPGRRGASGGKVYVTALPVDNKANKAVIKALADYLNTKKKSINIVKGTHSRNKVIEIDDRND